MGRNMRKETIVQIADRSFVFLDSMPPFPSLRRFEIGVSRLKVRNLIMRFAICNETHLLPLNPQMKTNGRGGALGL